MAVDRRRRRFVQAAAGWAGVSATGLASRLFARSLWLGQPRRFSFDGLVEHARKLADQAYHKPETPHAELIARIDYDAQRKINPRPRCALWADSDAPFAVEFLHLSRTADTPVAIHIVENSRARRVRYDPGLFSYADPALASDLPDDLGFAGLRVMRPGFLDIGPEGGAPDWLVFEGASYFRSSGELGQYGPSARGVAINTGLERDESFPRFSAFWIERPPAASDTQTIYALLEGEHLTGAYRFDCRGPDRVVMDVQARLFQRKPAERLGIAPLGSMYWYSQADHRQGVDWRPEVHDSDGLAIAAGHGGSIWRPLSSPAHPRFTRFETAHPKGFGLLQRDRDFAHYGDSRVHYERRPSVWVEPRGDWGHGAVALLELPTDDEIYDNIVAFWQPAETAAAGRQWRFDYRLSWLAEAPFGRDLASVVVTRTGRAGDPGSYATQRRYYRKFVIDYAGGPLAQQPGEAKPELAITATRGRIVNPYIKPVEGTPIWRVFFDWHGEDGDPPVELRCRLVIDKRAISETWIYSYLPHPLPPNAPNV